MLLHEYDFGPLVTIVFVIWLDIKRKGFEYSCEQSYHENSGFFVGLF